MRIVDFINALYKKNIILKENAGKLQIQAPNGSVTNDILLELKRRKSELINYLASTKVDSSMLIGRAKAELKSISYAQQRLWLLDQIDGGSAHYNMLGALKLTGALNKEVLSQAFTTILERHESLRTCFVLSDDGQPSPVIQIAAPFMVPEIDISELEESGRQQQLTQRICDEANRVFDLSSDLMLRVQLIKVAVDEHVVSVTMHHIASDAWSIAILINEFTALYSAYVQGQENPLPPLTIQYADYAHWQRNWLQGEVLNQQLSYWTAQLAGLPIVHSLPLDHPRPSIQTFIGKTYSSQIANTTSQALTTRCHAQGATLFMGLHAAFSVLLSRYSNETDIVVGSPIANREQAEIAPLIGFFVNTLVLRSDLSGNPSFTSLLNQSKGMLLDAYAHQQVPFEQIVERLQPERSLSHSPLFQVMLVLQNNAQGALKLPGLTLSPVGQSGAGIAKFDLTLNISESTRGLQLGWEYNTDLFDQETIARMANHFELLLGALVATPDENVFNVEILSASERHQLLVEWNKTTVDYPKDKCIHELFEAQVENNPDAVAVIFENDQLTYGELNQKANQLAHYLINEKQVKPDTLVGICIERSLAMVVGILGILKAGGTYVPLDPEYPEARLKYMLEDAQLTTVIIQRHLRETTPVTDAQAVCLDDENIQQILQTQSIQNPGAIDIGLTSRHLAYVIYTSGSTGNPKGVMVEHYNITRLLDSSQGHFNFGVQDIWTLFHSYAFDFSVWEIWGALAYGGRLVVVPYWISRSPADFYQLLIAQQVTVLNQTPSAFSSLIHEDLQQGNVDLALRYVIFGGEALNLAALSPWVTKHGDSQPQLINMYGITETTVHVTYRRLAQDVIENSQGTSLIGTPLADLKVLILNDQQALVPTGVAGELYVGGAGVTRGYLNQPKLTQSRFVYLPEVGGNDDGQKAGERYYRTGDLAAYTINGELEYRGRIDHQVKIRGFRIELGEIENALSMHDSVTEAIVLAKDLTAGDKRLVAYVVVDNNINEETVDRPVFIEQLRQHLNQRLPDYMIPSAFVLLDALPLTSNGKVDRNALPEPDLAQQQQTYIAPVTETEKVLCRIWQDVLGIERIGTSDNFFQLGGHSLLVMQVISRLQQAGITMAVRQLFATPTLAELAAAIDGSIERFIPVFTAPANRIPEGCDQITPDMLPLVNLSQDEINSIVNQVPGGAANVQDIYPLGPLQEGILFHHMLHPYSDPYVVPYLFRIADNQAVTRFINALQFVVNRHDVLRTAVLWNALSVPVQVVYRHVEVPVSWVEIKDGEDAFAHMQALCAPDIQQMDLTTAPLLKLHIATDSETGKCFVVLQMHHIIDDATSLKILQKEIKSYWAGYASQLPRHIPYREFIAHAQHQAQQHDASTYFQAVLGDIDEPTAPFNLVNVQGDGSRIMEYKADVPEAVGQQLRAIAKDLKISPAALFHSAWALLVAGCSGRDDVVFGTVVSGRLQGTIGAENMLGVFINTLPLRVKLNSHSALSLVRQVHQSLQELLPYEQASLTLAQRCTHLPADTPLFSAMLNYRHLAPMEVGDHVANDDAHYQDASASFEYIGGQERTNYPFNLSVDDLGEDGFALDVQVDNSVSAERITEYMQTALAGLVAALVSASDQPIAQRSIIPDTERHQLLVEWNNTTVDYPKDKCIHELFEAQVENNPDAVAVIFENDQLTYGELNQKANQLAHYLINEKQVKPDTLVGICIERSLAMVVGILGILKAGGTYVPLDPDYPEARLKYMLEDAQLTTVITQRHLRETTPVTDAQAVCLDDENIQQILQTQSIQNPGAIDIGLTSRHLAYVIYTSGSTGNPKGVMVAHHALVNRIDWMDSQYGSSPSDRILQKTPFSFDVSVWEFVWPLSVGAGIVLARPEGHKDPMYLSTLIRDQGVTKLHFVPSMLDSILSLGDLSQASLLRQVFCSGEALALHYVKAFHTICPQAKLHNLYGPTEAAIDVSYWDCSASHAGLNSVPIGRPINNIQLYVLNAQLIPSPENVAGELHIGGVGLARGYLNRPDLTAEKFIPNPFYDKNNPSSSERLYKTGDLVRWLPDGNLEFLGRIDHQVKIRGFRIELGEIENTLSIHTDVKDAIVLAKESATTGDKRLVAYVVTDAIDLQDDSETTIAARHNLIETLRQHLNQSLPDYMVPSAFVLLAQLPLTPNGKVDRKALPAPDMASQQQEYIAPRTPTEKILCEIWQEVLGVERVGITDNFFQLGGHSLLVISLITKMQKVGVDILAKELMQEPTVAGIAALAENQKSFTSYQYSYTDGDKIISLPNRQLLFKSTFINHWNMTGIINIENANNKFLEKALREILVEHKGLQHQFFVTDGYVFERISNVLDRSILDVVNLSGFESQESQSKEIERISANLQSTLDMTKTLFKFVIFNCGESAPSRFLWIMHHSIIDGYSLNIFLQELRMRYLSSVAGIPYQSTPLTNSVAEWGHYLHHYMNSAGIQKDIDYWTSLPWNQVGFLMDYPEGVIKNKSTDVELYGNDIVVTEKLNLKCSSYLLTLEKVNFSVADILFAAFSDTISTLTNSQYIRFEMVVNGRDKIVKGIDLSRTIGWLVDYVPVLIKSSEELTVSEKIQSYKQQYNDIPSSGLSFHGLKYLSDDDAVRTFFHSIPYAEFNINYVAPTKSLLENEAVSNLPRNLLSPGIEFPGNNQGDFTNMPIIWPSYIHIAVENGVYVFTWIARDNIYKKQTIQKAMSIWLSEIEKILHEIGEIYA